MYLRKGQTNDVVLYLWKHAVLTGRVIDSSGDPVTGMQVRPYKEGSLAGRRRLVPVGSGDKTDDTGSYRLSGLIPGRYVVVGGPGTDGEELAVFHPGTSEPTQASVVELNGGEERRGVDILLPMQRSFALSGSIVGLPDDRIVDVRLLYCADPNTLPDLEFGRFRSVPPHRFLFKNVPPGRYCIRFTSFPVGQFPQQQRGGIVVRRTGTSGMDVTSPSVLQVPTYSGSTEVAVGEEPIPHVTIVARTGARISGTILLTGEVDLPQGTNYLRDSTILLYAADGTHLGGNLPVTSIDHLGRFTTAGLPPGEYVLDVRIPGRRLYLRQINWAGQDYTRRPIPLGSTSVENVRITFGLEPTVLSGQVRGTSGEAVRDAVVFIFPNVREQWLDFGLRPDTMREVRSDDRGRYRFVGLPPGEYLVASVPGERAPEDWRNALSSKSWRVRLHTFISAAG
jgi:protocatechuate 3,4-dioxygenase beta subunit